MAVILYNILHPGTVDPQVNGFGIYRTVAGGSIGLLEAREKFPTNPQFSIVSPVDLNFRVNLDNTNLDRILYVQFALPFEVIDRKNSEEFVSNFGATWNLNDFAYTTLADRSVIEDSTSPAVLQGIGYRVTHQGDDQANFCMFKWEVEDLNGFAVTTTIAKGTYVWEGLSTSTTSPARVSPDSEAIRFQYFEVINNGNPRRPLTTLPVVPVTILSQSIFHDVTAAYGTQRWEREFVWLTQNSLSGNTIDASRFHSAEDSTGSENSEDVNGRRGTYLWEIQDYVTTQTRFWAYEDDRADSELGGAVETDNDVPPASNILSIFSEHAFLAGKTADPHHLFWSKRFRPESWPTSQFVEIGTANDPIRNHTPISGILGVFTNATKYRVDGNATSGFVHAEAISKRGTPSPESVIATDKGILFVARDGVYASNLIGPDTKLSQDIDPIFQMESTDTKNDYAPINWDQANLIAAEFYKNKYYFSYPSGSSTTVNQTAIYSFDTQKWTFWDVGFNSFYTEPDTDLLLAGGGDSIVYILEDGTNDNGTPISLELQTKDYVGATLSTRNLYLYFKVDADCSNESITAEFFVDGVSKRTVSLTGVRTKSLLGLPEETWGHTWRVKLTYTGIKPIKVYGVTAIYAPLNAA